MATPSKSVQIRNADTLCKMYERMKIPCWGIKQGAALNWKYEGEALEDGETELRAYLEMLEENETAAIYTLCLYQDPPGGRITDKTPADLSNNFRLLDNQGTVGSAEKYGGGYGALLAEIKELKKELNALKNQEPENKLGVLGDLMEYEAFQPIMMGLATRAADWIMGAGKVGELKRVSGIPGISEPTGKAYAGDWRSDGRISVSLDQLAARCEDLPQLMEQLAVFAVNKPGQFNLYKKMLMSMKS
jgi:hypothetical protein